MNFIFSLAHFCEVHGPTSILCTQLLPPSCVICTSNTATTASFGSETSNSAPGTAPCSRAGSTRSLNPRSNLSSSSTSSSRQQSPTVTPPLSPKHTHATSSVPALNQPSQLSIGSGSTDSCANCSLTLPKSLSDRLPVKDGKKTPMLRSREAVVTGGMAPGQDWQEPSVPNASSQKSQHRRRQSVYQPRSTSATDFEHINVHRRRSISSASSTSSCTNSSDEESLPRKAAVPPHTHNITYLSTRFPQSQSRYSALRRACVRTLSCESLPTQTGPIFVGDSDTGYTIAYVFRLSDPKARGGRRTYALLCLCPEVKKIVSSYGYVTSVFEGLVARIKEMANIASRPSSAGNDASSVSSSTKFNSSPEGFLRRPPRPNTGKDLAGLLGREQLFVEVHACFAQLLGGLARRFGCLDETEETSTAYAGALSLNATSLSTGGLTAADRELYGASRSKSRNGRDDEFRREMFV